MQEATVEATDNYDDFLEAPTQSGFDNLDKLIGLQRGHESTVERLEEELSTAKNKLKNIAEHELPTLMDQMGLKEFKTNKGFKIEIKKSLRVSIAGAKKGPAHQWLKDHKHGDIIKRCVIIPFMVNEAEKAIELAEELEKKYGTVGNEEAVSPQTLKALISKLLKQGVDVPMQTFGAFEQCTAKITA